MKTSVLRVGCGYVSQSDAGPQVTFTSLNDHPAHVPEYNRLYKNKSSAVFDG